MDVKHWTVCLIEPNKFEAQIIVDLLRSAGVVKIKSFARSDDALEVLEVYNANVIIASHEMGESDGAAWTRTFRRNGELVCRKAAIFVTASAFSREMAEDYRHAGANALIGKPVSGKVLLAIINKVLKKPRTFVEAEGYVGPCRRAGIVMAGAPRKRRHADEASAEPTKTVRQIVDVLTATSAALAVGGEASPCEAALRDVQAYAVNSGDGPLMRACAAFTLLLSSKNLRTRMGVAALGAVVDGVGKLAALPCDRTHEREAIAERVRLAVGKAVLQRAA